MKINHKVFAIILLFCSIQSCSKDDYPVIHHFRKVIELPAYYIDPDSVSDIKQLKIVQVSIINSQEYLSEFFTNINTEIPSELSQVDFKKYSFLYVANVTRYSGVVVKNDLKKTIVDSKGLTNYTYTVTEYYNDTNLIKDPTSSLIYYTGIVVDKIDDDTRIDFMHGGSNKY